MSSKISDSLSTLLLSITLLLSVVGAAARPSRATITAHRNVTSFLSINSTYPTTQTTETPTTVHNWNSTSTVRSESASSTPYRSSGRQQPKLSPAVHWDQPAKGLENLSPKSNQFFYYTNDGSADSNKAHSFSEIFANTSYPAVVLPHALHIEAVRCEVDTTYLSSADKSTLAHIESIWRPNLPIILATLTDGCGDSLDQYTFLLITGIKIDVDTNQVQCATKRELSIEEALPEVEFTWGTYHPPQDPSSTVPVPSSAPYPTNSSSLLSNGTNISNGTNSANSSNCAPPPSRMIDGLYAATCGSPTFDIDIDDEIGYLDFDSAHYSASLAEFSPGLDDDYGAADNADFGPTESRKMARSFGSSFLKKVGNVVGNLATSLKNVAVDAGKQVLTAVSNALAITPEASVDLPINVGPSGLVDSPFGNAKQIYYKAKDAGAASGNIAVYCVDCGVKGSVHLYGRARYAIGQGLTEANAGMKGNLAAGLKVGIAAEAEIKQTFRQPLLSEGVPYPGFSVPGIYAIGPVVTLDAEVDLGINLAGQVLAGLTMSIPDFAINLDLVDTSKSLATGFTPTFEKVFEAKTKISASASFGLPLGIGLGIDIVPLKYRKTVALYEKPSVGAKITYSGSTTGEGVGGDTTCVNGLAHELFFANNIYADFFSLTKLNINEYKYPLLGACLPLGGNGETGTGNGTGAGEGTGADPTSGDGIGSEEPARSPSDDTQRRRRMKREVGDSNDDDYDNDDPDLAPDNAEFDELSDEALADADKDASSSSAAGDNSTTSLADDTGSSYVYINDQFQSYSLYADPDTGNILVSALGSGSLFLALSGYVIGDEADRYLHYYPDLMEKYGVSRFRVSDETHIPKDADLAVLAPVDLDDSAGTPSVYGVLDTRGNAFLPITCDIGGEDSKVFLARGEEGAKTLMGDELKYTVTGGIVQSCYYIPWVVGGAYTGS